MSSEAFAGQENLAHHFESYEQQKESSFLGMWLFICQETLFFGGAFAAYVHYRVMYPEAFMAGSQELNAFIGFLNTLVLLCSSFTMVYAVWAAQNDKGPRKIAAGLYGTLFFGTVFLVVKYFEYGSKFEHHLVPGYNFLPPAGADEATEIFFSLYFGMTGLHALHMVIGMGIMAVMLYGLHARKQWANWGRKNHNFVEGFGLYWHFVDIVWIFLFPFLYLVDATPPSF